MKTWDERDDPRSPAPERVIVGPPVEGARESAGQEETLGLAEALEDPGRRGFAMRFGGHRANVPEWHSGCVVCLYSGPGSKVGNAAYTVRDWVQGTTRFHVRRGALPADGKPVTIVLRLLPEGRKASRRSLRSPPGRDPALAAASGSGSPAVPAALAAKLLCCYNLVTDRSFSRVCLFGEQGPQGHRRLSYARNCAGTASNSKG